MSLSYAGDRLRNGVSFAAETGIGKRASWQEIDEDGRDLAARLGALGVAGPDRPVVVVGATSRHLVVAIRAVVESEAPLTVLAPTDRRRGAFGAGELARQIEGVAPTVVLCADLMGEAWDEAGLPGKRIARLGSLEVIDVSGGTDSSEGGSAGSQATLLQFTSGSTRTPRPVAISRENLLANIDAMVDRTGFDQATDRFLSWLPLYHDMGLVAFLLLPMLRGIDLVLADPLLFLRRPTSWLRWISESRATVTCAPQFAYSVTGRKQGDLGDLDLACLRMAMNGAEPVDPEGVRRFFDLGARHRLRAETMTCGYGLAEATLAVSIAEPGSGLVTDRVDADVLETAGRAVQPAGDARPVELARLGSPLHGLEVRVVTEDRQLAEAAQLGEIEVRGGSVTRGYWRMAEGDRRPRGEWLGTGDLGYLSEGGELVVWGRKKDVIVIGGRNYSPVAIERVVATVDGIRSGNAAAFGVANRASGTESLVVVAETRSPTTGLAQGVRSAVRDAFGLVTRDILLVQPGSVPKTTSGKVRRSASRALFEAGGFEV